MNRCLKAYSAAVSDVISGKFFATFGIPGQYPQWVMAGSTRRTFDTAEEAELWGWRILGATLNRSQTAQSFTVKKDNRKTQTFHAPGPKPSFEKYLKPSRAEDLQRVFSKPKV